MLDNSMLSKKYLEALEFAFDLHKNQKRKGTNVPYFSHLESTASIVWKNGGTEIEAIAALLHDAPEDQGGTSTLKMIEKQFGSEVARIVLGCSESLEMPRLDWLLRKKEYLGKLSKVSRSVRLVSAADKLDNIQDIYNESNISSENLWNRFNANKASTLWFYQTAGEIFLQFGPNMLGKRIVDIVEILKKNTP